MTERTFACVTGYRRLAIRYARSASLYYAFVTLAAVLTNHERYLRLTTWDTLSDVLLPLRF